MSIMDKLKKPLLLSMVVTGLMAQTNIDNCYACHGINFEKQAMGKSKVVADMNNTALINSMLGYQDGNYGGPLKVIMENQLKDLTVDQIEEIAELIVDIKEYPAKVDILEEENQYEGVNK